ncbi:HD domain-containing protein [bacterium]|nr:MAG: HD domain-containing protein [bacterium]
MAINFKKELESAAKSMILVHQPNLLIKMILRMLIEKIKVSHASILLHHKDKDAYILTDSRGCLGPNLPIGLARMDKDDALIHLFRGHKNKLLSKSGVLVYQQAQKIISQPGIEGKFKALLQQVLYQMDILETIVCVPSYFRDDLLGIILLGKRAKGKEFAKDELDFFTALANNVAMAIRNAQLFKELEDELHEKRELFIRIIVALAAAIEAKDYYTHGHTSRVTNLSLEIAKKIVQNMKFDFKKDFFEELHIASLLHDIGKIGIPEAILNKNSPLSDEEWRIIRKHPLIGVTILQPIKELEDSILGVKYHHERHDGNGYPEGLKGDAIPMIASIISVADSFDAMTSDRPYRHGLYRDDAINEIRRLRGAQFNPNAADAFIELCSENKI